MIRPTLGCLRSKAGRLFGAESTGAEVVMAIYQLPDGGADTLVDRLRVQPTVGARATRMSAGLSTRAQGDWFSS